MIPEAAVEAALAARLTFKNQRGMDNAANQMRHILEAAAPHMLADANADALKEAGELIEPFSGIGMSNGATRGEVSAWLKARAEAYRGAAHGND